MSRWFIIPNLNNFNRQALLIEEYSFIRLFLASILSLGDAHDRYKPGLIKDRTKADMTAPTSLKFTFVLARIISITYYRPSIDRIIFYCGLLRMNLPSHWLVYYFLYSTELKRHPHFFFFFYSQEKEDKMKK